MKDQQTTVTETPYAPLGELLRQLILVLEQLNDEEYVETRARGISGSIGGHVRHCLDHVNALVTGANSGEINYDLRRRDTRIEQRRDAAVFESRRLCDTLLQIAGMPPDSALKLWGALETEGPPIASTSTLGREVAFVVSHTIHHFAVIALLLWDMGRDVPPRFGYAPSTPTAA
jgi:uncharacterized damage-inducible protein DinB